MPALAAWPAARPPSRRYTYGLGKAELLAALAMLAMLAMVAFIGVEAWQRLQAPARIDGATVGVVAVLGFLVNLLVAWVLSRGQKNLNVRAALLHVMGDVLGSLVAIVSGAVIYFTGWTPIDALLSLLIGGLILSSSIALLREALDGVQAHIDIAGLGRRLAAVPGVSEVHDLHVWPIGAERLALSAHVRVDSFAAWPQILRALSDVPVQQGIGHVTFQPEPAGLGVAQPVSFSRQHRH